MKPRKAVPDCLVKLAEYNTAKTQAEALMVSLINMPEDLQLESEIDFLENQISDCKQKISELEPECEQIFERIKRKNQKAYIAARLHFAHGAKWEDVAIYLGGEPAAIRTQVYRAFTSLRKESKAF